MSTSKAHSAHIISLAPSPDLPPGKKRSGEGSRISLAYVRLVIIMLHFLYKSKKNLDLYSSMHLA